MPVYYDVIEIIGFLVSAPNWIAANKGRLPIIQKLITFKTRRLEKRKPILLKPKLMCQYYST